MQFLLFQIYAPLVSWGEIAVGGERQSSRHPSKSAIIGLVAAALGIRRDEEERLNSLAGSLGMAVQLYSGGSMLKDFHTVQVPKKENKVVHHTRRSELSASQDKIGTILSRREYRCDAFAVVAIYLKKIDADLSLQKIENALHEPEFHLYFGRKSCVPALPLDPKSIMAASVKVAFKEYEAGAFSKTILPVSEKKPDWLKKAFEQYPKRVLTDSNGVTYFWEDGVEPGFESLQSVERYDQPISRKRWQFTTRQEYMAIDNNEEAVNVPQ